MIYFLEGATSWLIWWGEAPERLTTFRNAAPFAQTNSGAGRKNCRAGPRVCHVLEIKRRWDRLGSESVLHTMSVRKPSRFVGFLSAVPEPRPTKLTTRPTARAPISDITIPVLRYSITPRSDSRTRTKRSCATSKYTRRRQPNCCR